MEIRRRNFTHPQSASKEHPVRCCHLIGNVRSDGLSERGDLLVRSNFHVLLYYRGEQRSYGGRYEHHLVESGDTLRIRHKKVTLINCDAPQRSLTIYL
jgi:3-phenylpropionate/cinnamic acid dioxygenase small subunit